MTMSDKRNRRGWIYAPIVGTALWVSAAIIFNWKIILGIFCIGGLALTAYATFRTWRYGL